MDNPQKPKKEQSLTALGGLLILGGVLVLRQARRTDAFPSGTPT